MTTPKPFSRAAAAAARLRPMLPSDLDAVLALEHELFPDDAWTPEMFAEEVAMPADSRLYLVAEAGVVQGEGPGLTLLAGYAGLLFVPDGVTADVLTIAVSRESWGRGI